MQFDADSIRIGQPGLPGMVGSHLFLADGIAGRGETCVDFVDRIGFQTEMIDGVDAGFHRFPLEKFKVVAVADPEVEADDFAVADEVERFAQPEPIAVETGGLLQIDDPDAEMSDSCDHK